MLTNEEECATMYPDYGEPTTASGVTPDTPLECLNLNWQEADLPEKERTKHVHRLHPYLGKFIPQLVEIFLRKYFAPGQTVLDPFCGSGTTLVQANELGINAIGYDISAFNVLLCHVKTARYDLARVEKEVLGILERVRLATQLDARQLTLWPVEGGATTKSTLPESFGVDNGYLKEWFAPQALQELLTYRHFIETGGYEYQNLLKIILSRSARSARLTTHFDLDFPKHPQTEPYWCYKHSRECRPTQEAFKFIRRYSLDALKRTKQFADVRTDATTIIRHADSREGGFPPIDGVITSPPYVGLIDYHEQHIYAYHLLGLEDKRNHEIGPATNGSGKKARQQYQSDIAEVFSRAADAMPVGGRMIVIANDRSELYGDIAERIGVEVEDIVNRHVNRRTGRRSTEFYESIFIWRKCADK
ncbi:MAG: DNA methyltransferase [Candidatus Methanogasteraceae archaeon]